MGSLNGLHDRTGLANVPIHTLWVRYVQSVVSTGRFRYVHGRFEAL